MRPTIFCETVGDVEAQAPVITIHHNLAQVKAETPREILRDVETETSPDTLAERLAEVKATKVGETLTDVEGAPIV